MFFFSVVRLMYVCSDWLMSWLIFWVCLLSLFFIDLWLEWLWVVDGSMVYFVVSYFRLVVLCYWGIFLVMLVVYRILVWLNLMSIDFVGFLVKLWVMIIGWSLWLSWLFFCLDMMLILDLVGLLDFECFVVYYCVYWVVEFGFGFVDDVFMWSLWWDMC